MMLKGLSSRSADLKVIEYREFMRLLRVYQLTRSQARAGWPPEEEVDHPLVFFGGKFFPNPQFRERTIELEWRIAGVGMAYQQLCAGRAAAAENKSRLLVTWGVCTANMRIGAAADGIPEHHA